MKISDIKISPEFAFHPPYRKKIDKKRDRMYVSGKQNKPIVINDNGLLIDGYATLLAMIELGYTECRCIYQKHYGNYEKNELLNYRHTPTTYIYGIHPDSKEKKTYIWRVPSKSRESIYKEVLPGDTVLVNTKHGNKAVVVTKIETLDECPVDFMVRKFIRKLDD